MNVLIALDQFGNALLGGAPDETISSRAGRARPLGRRWARWLCWALDKIDSGHCKDATAAEERGNHLPPELRRG
jgi:hypothetical protein